MRIVTVNGIPRSGSTLVQQLVEAVFFEVSPEILIQRTHPAIKLPEYGHCFITIRHPYEVAASRYRVRLSRDPNTGGKGGLVAEMNEMAKHYQALGSLYYLPHTLLHYEDFVTDYNIVYTAIEQYLGGILSPRMKERISNQYNIISNKARSKKLSSFNEVDITGIHGDHISGMSWQSTLPEELHQPMLDFCQPIAEYHHYE